MLIHLLTNLYSKILSLRSDILYKLLINRGLKVGHDCSFQSQVHLDHSFPWLISIGDNVTLAMNVIVLAHDASMKRKLGYTRIGKVDIGNNVFIGASTVILPNTTIGDNSIIGAGSVVSNNIPSNVVAAGNPAKVLSSVEEFWSKHKHLMEQRPLYEEDFTINKNPSHEMKEHMKLQMVFGEGYIR